jgi:hypothetical protein
MKFCFFLFRQRVNDEAVSVVNSVIQRCYLQFQKPLQYYFEEHLFQDDWTDEKRVDNIYFELILGIFYACPHALSFVIPYFEKGLKV